MAGGFKASAAFKTMSELKEKTYVDTLLDEEKTPTEVAGIIVKELWEKKIRKEDVKKISCKVVLDPANVPAVDPEFEREVKKKFGIKKEIERISKRQKTMIHLFNAQMEIASYTEYLLGEGSEKEDREEIKKNLEEAQKIALLITKKIMEDSAKDMRDLARSAAGLSKAKDPAETMVMEEEDKEDLKAKKEEKKEEDLHTIARNSGRGNPGRQFNQQRGQRYFEREANRIYGRGYRSFGNFAGASSSSVNRGRGGGRASRTSPDQERR